MNVSVSRVVLLVLSGFTERCYGQNTGNRIVKLEPRFQPDLRP